MSTRNYTIMQISASRLKRLNLNTIIYRPNLREQKDSLTLPDPKRGLQNYSVVNNSERETDTNVIHQLAETLASLSHTPTIKIKKFSGDPKDYFRFATRFRGQVLSQPIQDSKMLSCLMQYVDGKAKEAVERFEGMGSGALAEALNVLKTRFGRSYMIVDAYIGSIVKGPSIANGDGKALQKLADKRQSVLTILESMNSLNEISSDHPRKVVARLPFYNQSRWRDRASDLLRERGVPPNFRDLTEFLQRRAESENNPLFAALKDPEKEISNRSQRELERKRKEEPISSFATQHMCGRFGYERRTVCPVCQ